VEQCCTVLCYNQCCTQRNVINRGMAGRLRVVARRLVLVFAAALPRVGVQACLPTEKAPLPSDIQCQPCTAADFNENVGTCADINGNHNVTYTWSVPKVCSSALPNRSADASERNRGDVRSNLPLRAVVLPEPGSTSSCCAPEGCCSLSCSRSTSLLTSSTGRSLSYSKLVESEEHSQRWPGMGR